METLNYFESVIDEEFNKIKMTSDNKSQEIWRVLTVFEDYMYFNILGFLTQIKKSQKITDNSFLISIMEKHKLTLKLYLSQISEKCQHESEYKKDNYFNGKNYIQIKKSIDQIDIYMQLRWFVIAVYQKMANFKNNGTRNIFKNNDDYCQSSVLQQYHRSNNENFSKDIQRSGLAMLLGYIALGEKSDIYDDLLKISIVQGHKISYTFDNVILKKIYLNLSNSKSMELPENWVFPWASLADFRMFFNALNTISIFHFACIHINADHHSIKGGGIDHRILSLKEKEFIDLICAITELDTSTTTTIVKNLTYGFKVLNPDPALQPLFISNNEVLIAPLLITTLNYDRNALSLHLRIDEKSFNKSSEAFEDNMTQVFLKSIPDRYHKLSNFHLPNSSGGEIDAAIIDVETKTLIIYELKWMLTPSDPNEVFNKIKECRKKVVQTEKKLLSAKNNIEFLLRRFEVKDKNTKDWNIAALVVIDGFSGVNHQDMPHIKMIPSWVHENLIKSTHSLQELSRFILSNTWLPKEGLHYKKVKSNINFAGKKITIAGMELINIDDYYHRYIPEKLIEHRSAMKQDN